MGRWKYMRRLACNFFCIDKQPRYLHPTTSVNRHNHTGKGKGKQEVAKYTGEYTNRRRIYCSLVSTYFCLYSLRCVFLWVISAEHVCMHLRLLDNWYQPPKRCTLEHKFTLFIDWNIFHRHCAIFLCIHCSHTHTRTQFRLMINADVVVFIWKRPPSELKWARL